MENTTSSSFGKRVLAVIVLAIAVWLLLKFVIGLITGIATLVVIVLAVMAVIWAVRTL